jgi:hypothetical protein
LHAVVGIFGLLPVRDDFGRQLLAHRQAGRYAHRRALFGVEWAVHLGGLIEQRRVELRFDDGSLFATAPCSR